jgi:hypothetical protein
MNGFCSGTVFRSSLPSYTSAVSPEPDMSGRGQEQTN